ncbi:MAG: hypothetical protein B7X99_01680 [Rhizobiales bacterium 17-65-6]|nr:MAG: hypothetical protein B7Y84_03690 [Azorhizobium sp. 32-67-21]OZA01180.1 MAG: hypothetical protein B7X99_01680 [Rhizobiales bacterium 17-65-6]OZA85118.1 MAG: hypothetical protein B7X76_05710 [Azorhizobium sp. 39-67-5]
MTIRSTPLFIVLLALTLAGCESSSFVPWPPQGSGGLAERRPSTDARIDALQQRLFRQGERNARYYAAAEFQDAELMMIRVRRLSEGGFPEDCEIEIARLKLQMDKIDRILAHAPSSGKGA